MLASERALFDPTCMWHSALLLKRPWHYRVAHCIVVKTKILEQMFLFLYTPAKNKT